MKVRDYKQLDVWKKGVDIVDLVYEITSKFPRDEKYGLASNMQRAAVSIPSNVAEGFARQHRKEYKQFLFIALGSCAELETQTIVGKRRGFISEDDFAKMVEDLDHESRMLTNLIKSLKI